MALRYEVDQGQLNSIIQKLTDVAGNKTRSKFANAINKMSTRLNKELKQKSKATYTFKGSFSSLKRTKRASPGDLHAVLSADGNTESLYKFQMSAGGDGVTAAIRRGETFTVNKYGNKAFIGKGKLNGQVYVRMTKARFPLEVIKGRSQPYMIGDHEVLDPTIPKTESLLAQMVDLEVQRILGG